MPEAKESHQDVLHALRRKYAWLIALRTDATEGVPRGRLRALARDFPGSLRELDVRTISDLQCRLAELDSVVAGARPVPQWVWAQHVYHGFLRAALRLRPTLREQGPRLNSLQSYVPGFGEPAAAQLTESWLGRVERPPGGRLNPVAYAFVAEVLSLSQSEVEALLIPTSRSCEL